MYKDELKKNRDSVQSQLMRIIIAGAHGFIGSHLLSFFKKKGYQAVALSRRATTKEPDWDPVHLENADVVINLCGENILGRWTKKKMENIRTSRLESSRLLCQAILALQNPPKLFIQASAVGYYGDRKEVLTEESQSGYGYLSEVCRLWEAIPNSLKQKDIRVALFRFGIVLDPSGGALKKMLPPFRWGMGGKIGDGQQMISWIAMQDLLEACDFVIHHDISGPVNFVSPQSVSNQEFTKTLGKVLKRPTPFPIPKFFIKLLFGAGAEVFLSSVNVKPQKLEKHGYHFKKPDLESALVVH